MKNILWISPNFNHYKSRFLNSLAKDIRINLDVLSGAGRVGYGDLEINKKWSFQYKRLQVSKSKFGFSIPVYSHIYNIFSLYDWILIPLEKKCFFLFIYLLLLRFFLNNSENKVKLISYCHPITKSKNGKFKLLNFLITKFFYKNLDRVIFYTEDSYKLAVEKKWIDSKRAYWSNNTIDTNEVKKYYQFTYPPTKVLRILFIGRLIPSKKVDVAIKYFELLQKKFSNKNIELEIIGDGPSSEFVKTSIKRNKKIKWHKSIVDEALISPIMKRSSFVFLPGDSGLSINHAFSYGRPFVTLNSENHGPEISYLSHNKNGLILDEREVQQNINMIEGLLKNKNMLRIFCDNAKEKSDELSIENWIRNIIIAFTDE